MSDTSDPTSDEAVQLNALLDPVSFTDEMVREMLALPLKPYTPKESRPMPDSLPPDSPSTPATTADRARAACEQASPGPWTAKSFPSAGWLVSSPVGPVCPMTWWQFDMPGVMDNDISAANARLIAEARTLLPLLAAEADAKDAEIGRLRAMMREAREWILVDEDRCYRNPIQEEDWSDELREFMGRFDAALQLSEVAPATAPPPSTSPQSPD